MLLILGGILALLGLLLLLAGRVPYPSTGSFDELRTASGHRLGRLPGDLTICFPVVTWLALSPSTGSFDELRTASGHRLALTLLLNLAPYWDTGLAFRVLRR